MNNNQIKAIILAAGKGTRMKSDRAKVMHGVFFAPMLQHVLAAIAPLDIQETVVVTGHQADVVESAFADSAVVFARQAEQLGTAHAVLATELLLADFVGTVLILCGDTPLIRSETLEAMLSSHRERGSRLTVMTTVMENPDNYGRIITDESGHLLKIVEEKDASPLEKEIKEINAGVYCVDAGFLFEGLKKVGADNRQGEFYLTDLVEIAGAGGLPVTRHVCTDPQEVLGVNSRIELAGAHRELQLRRNYQLMKDGVTIIDPYAVEISPEVRIGADTEIARNVSLSGGSVVGCGCKIGMNTVIRDCRIGDRVTIGSLCFLANHNVGADEIVSSGTVVRDDKS